MNLDKRFQAEKLLKDAKQEFTDKEEGFEFKVLQLVRSAIALGHPEAKFAAAYLGVTDFPGAEEFRARAKELMIEAAEEGYPYAYFAIGALHENGGVDGANPADAFKYYLLGACAGDPRAGYEVARCYAHGIGVDKDTSLAEKLMEISLSRAYFGMWD